ncbi:MAG: threonine/serine dehydratase [Woeseiaceae bacterium]|nr:threonine/serine dehydratase [Woeseiaceae bacterium]
MTGFADVEAAARRLDGVAVRTPLFEHPELNARVGGRVLVKAENLQRTGSFKIRGAYNRMCQLDDERRQRGVVAWSSGNHAQGVACAGRLLGIATAIVMPEDAPAAKRSRTLAWGGEIIDYDRYSGDREAIARELAARRGAALVPSYDHRDVIAGQGTVGLEIAQQATACGAELDQVLIGCSGGGLTAGCAVALHRLAPRAKLYTVEPEAFDDTARSLSSGQRLCAADDARSICDALQAKTPGELTFAINRERVTAGLSVSDAEVCDAMRFAFGTLKMVVEPGGAVALAAVLAGRIEVRDRVTAVVVSGGNVDVGQFARIQAEPR